MDRLRQFWIASVGVCHSRCWHRRLQNCSPGNTKVRCRLYPPPTSKTSLSESLPFAAKYKYMSGGSFSAIPVTYTMYVCMYVWMDALHCIPPGRDTVGEYWTHENMIREQLQLLRGLFLSILPCLYYSLSEMSFHRRNTTPF